MRRILKQPAIWWGIILLTLAFIWGQSLLNQEQSSEQSTSVQEWLRCLFGDSVFDSFLFQNIRKVAHFTEYALLGGEWMGYRLAVSGRAKPTWWLVILTGPVVAGCDELLQAASDRAPRVTDVLLDSSGYACGLLVIFGLYILYQQCRKKYSAKK